MALINRNNQPGFVILFTILIASIILLIGFGIFSIATRETVLSSTSREAQAAFYAADAGVECALYAQAIGLLTSGGGTFVCGEAKVTVTGAGQPALPYEFDVMVDVDNKTCAHVTVFDVNAGAARRVVSQGYNICNDQALPSRNNPILVERVLDTTYGLVGSVGPLGAGGTIQTATQGLSGAGTPLGSTPVDQTPIDSFKSPAIEPKPMPSGNGSAGALQSGSN